MSDGILAVRLNLHFISGDFRTKCGSRVATGGIWIRVCSSRFEATSAVSTVALRGLFWPPILLVQQEAGTGRAATRAS